MTSKEYWRARYEKDFKPAYDAFIALYPFTLENIDGEEWADIEDYEGLYQVSTFGRIKSLWRGKEKILKPKMDGHGYLRINLHKDCVMKTYLISRLVALHFIPNPFNLPQIDHCSGIKLDNSINNLRWVTGFENQQYAVQNGLKKAGEFSPNAKLTDEQIVYIRENPDQLSRIELAQKFKICRQTITNIQTGKRYKNAGGIIRKKIRR